MRFSFGIYELDVDLEKTRAFYAGQHTFQGCGCDDCRNFEALEQRFPEDIASFLRSLGIDPRKPAEVIALAPQDAGHQLYLGYYHLCGTILYGMEHMEREKGTKIVNQSFARHKLSQTADVYFREKLYAAEDNLPSPAFQLEIGMVLPWVLDETMPESAQ